MIRIILRAHRHNYLGNQENITAEKEVSMKEKRKCLSFIPSPHANVHTLVYYTVYSPTFLKGQ